MNLQLVYRIFLVLFVEKFPFVEEFFDGKDAEMERRERWLTFPYSIDV